MALASWLAGGALAACAAASAQAPVATGGDYGGGALARGGTDLSVGSAGTRIGVGNMLISLRVTDGTLQLNATLGATCDGVSFSARPTLKPSGAFSTSGVKQTRFAGGRIARTSFDVEGTVSGTSASGTARVRNRITRRGVAAKSCASPEVRWNARRASGEIGAAGALPGALLYGTTSQRLRGVKRAIVMRALDARWVNVLHDLTLRCGGRPYSDWFDATYPYHNVQVAPGGVIDDAESAGSPGRESSKRWRGKIGMTGASGSFTLSRRVIDGPTGATISSCDSGVVTWQAAP